MRQRTSRIFTLAILLGFISSVASSYVLLSPARRWFSTPKTIYIDNGGLASVTDADLGVTAAVNATNAWNLGSVTPVVGVAATVVYALGDGRSDVIFADPLGICTGNCLAATTTGYYNTGSKACCDGLDLVQLTDADVCFNTSYNFTSASEPDGCSSEIYLETVTTHEIGHVIGLGHSANSGAVMYASVSYCNNKLMNSDDVNGRDALYDCAVLTFQACGAGPPPTCKVKGVSCTVNSECCSNRCRGRSPSKICG